MRILYLADIRFPLERANGVQTIETCYALAERGHSVTLLVRPDTARCPRDPFRFYGLEPHARVHVRRAAVVGPAPLRRVAYFAHVLRTVPEFAASDSLVFTRDLGVASVVLRLPRATRPPLVYESHGYAPVFAETMPELVAGAAAGSSAKVQRLVRRERRVWRRADGYVTTTKVLARELEERFGSREALATIPNGTRLSARPPFSFRAPAPSPVVAYAGHLYAWKGVDVLVLALAHLSDVRCLIIGGHPAERDLARIQNAARELAIAHRITFVGAVGAAEVPSLLERADILVLPTVATASARYTSPLKLFEYMAAGRPIVASDLPPIREIARDGENACLVPPADPAALAAAIRGLLDNPRLAERIARCAFEEAPRFAWDRRAERLEDLFGQIAGRS